jgi:CHASE2 domain-containing sensor protein
LLLSCRFNGLEGNIVLVGVDTLNRQGIAEMISKINAGSPAVVAVDLNFVGHTEYSRDHALVFALSDCKKLVMATIIYDFNENKQEFARFIDQSEPEFLVNAKTGFINAILDSDSTLQRFVSHANVSEKKEYHFAIQTAMMFDSLKTVKYLSDHGRIENLNLKDGRRNFKVLTSDVILSNQFKPQELKDKIVMLGYLGPLQEDIFFSPISKTANPDKPDMYGLEYLAHIVVQVLEY